MPKLNLKSNKSSLRQKLRKNSILKPMPKQFTQFVSTGSWILNMALTNDVNLGYPVGRVVNSVGDYSTGKTLMACETVNAVWYEWSQMLGKKVKIYYDEPESAFDMDLAMNFNMPLDQIVG